MLCCVWFKSFQLCWFCLFRDIVPGFSDNDLRHRVAVAAVVTFSALLTQWTAQVFS